MSELMFDGTKHTLTFFRKDGSSMGGDFPANNIVDSKIKDLRFLPNGFYTFLDKNRPHTHGHEKSNNVLKDSENGSYGTYGIFRIEPFSVNGKGHSGVGVHSGRKSGNGVNHATHGCIRTTDEAMQAIMYYILNDPLEQLVVVNNHDQRNPHPQKNGDPHNNTTPLKKGTALA